MVVGFPLNGGLGECQVCGKSFTLEIMLGRDVCIGTVPGIEQELAIHMSCKKHLEGKVNWKTLPDGPLRRVFAEVYGEAGE